ncbi:MAG TPA: GNAT family N-acetyltransferase [Anaerolineaceae bacterium]|nr:GNAT family N-acetyltransferase [Anaerolineaceae bacterium]
MNFKIANRLDEKIWSDFVNQHPQGNIFHTPEMYQVFLQAKGYQPELRAAVTENGQVVALFLPVQVSLKNGFMSRLTTRSIAYGSTLCTPDSAGKEALEALLSDYAKKTGRKSLYTELRHLSDLSAIQPIFTNCGFEYQEHLNYLIDLDCTTEELFMKIGSRTRKHIRRAIRKEQIVLYEVENIQQIKFIFEMIKKSYLEAQIPVASISLFEAAFKVLYPLNMVKFTLVRLGNTYIASSVELIFKDVIYGWYGGVDRAYSSYTPSEFLTWHILKWGSENGYLTYDFGGAGSPDEEYGVRDFKAKFGGSLVCYGRNTYVHDPILLQISTAGYNILRYFTRNRKIFQK